MFINGFFDGGVKNLFKVKKLKESNTNFDEQWKIIEKMIKNPIDVKQNSIDKWSNQCINLKFDSLNNFNDFFNYNKISDKDRVKNTFAFLTELPKDEQETNRQIYNEAQNIVCNLIKTRTYKSYLNDLDLEKDYQKQAEKNKNNPSYIQTNYEIGSGTRVIPQFAQFLNLTDRELYNLNQNSIKNDAINKAEEDYKEIEEDYLKLKAKIEADKKSYPNMKLYRDTIQKLSKLNNQPPRNPVDPKLDEKDKKEIEECKQILQNCPEQYKEINKYIEIRENLKTIHENNKQIMDSSAKITNGLKIYFKLAMEATRQLSTSLSDKEFLKTVDKYKEILFMMTEQDTLKKANLLNYDRNDKELKQLMDEYYTNYKDAANDTVGVAIARLSMMSNPYYVKYDKEQLISFFTSEFLESTDFYSTNATGSASNAITNGTPFSSFDSLVQASNQLMSTRKIMDNCPTFDNRLHLSISLKLHTDFNDGNDFKFYNSSTGEEIITDINSTIFNTVKNGNDIIAIGKDGTIKSLSTEYDNQGFLDIRNVDTISYGSEDLSYVQSQLSSFINELPDHESIFFSNQTASFINFSNTLKELSKMSLTIQKPQMPTMEAEYIDVDTNEPFYSIANREKYERELEDYHNKIDQYNAKIKEIKDKIQTASLFANEYLEDKKWTTKKFTSNTWDRINFARRFRDRFLNANKLEDILKSNDKLPKDSIEKIHETLKDNNDIKKINDIMHSKKVQERRPFIAYGDKNRNEIEFNKEMSKYYACKYYISNTLEESPFALTDVVSHDDRDFLNRFEDSKNRTPDDYTRAINLGHKLYGFDKEPDKLTYILTTLMEANIEFKNKPKPSFYQFKAKEMRNLQSELLQKSFDTLRGKIIITQQQYEDLLEINNIEDAKKYIKERIVKQVNLEAVSGTDLVNDIKELFEEQPISNFDLKFTKAIEDYTAAKQANDIEKMAQNEQLYKDAILLKYNIFPTADNLIKAIMNYSLLENIHNRDVKKLHTDNREVILSKQVENLREIKETYILKFISEDDLKNLKDKSYDDILNDLLPTLFSTSITSKSPFESLDIKFDNVNKLLNIPNQKDNQEYKQIKDFAGTYLFGPVDSEGSLQLDNQEFKQIDNILQKKDKLYFNNIEIKDAKSLYDCYLAIKREEYGFNNVTKLTQFIIQYKNYCEEFDKVSNQYNEFINLDHNNIDKELNELKDVFNKKEESFINIKSTIIKCGILTSNQLNELTKLDDKEIEKYILNNVYTEYEKAKLERLEIFDNVNALIQETNKAIDNSKKLFTPNPIDTLTLLDEDKLMYTIITANMIDNKPDNKLINEIDARKEEFGVSKSGDELLKTYRKSQRDAYKLNNMESIIMVLKDLGSQNAMFNDLKYNYQTLLGNHEKQANSEEMRVLFTKLATLEDTLKNNKNSLIKSGLFSKATLDFALKNYNNEKVLSTYITMNVFTPDEISEYNKREANKPISIKPEINNQLNTINTKLDKINGDYVKPKKKESMLFFIGDDVFDDAYKNIIKTNVSQEKLANIFMNTMNETMKTKYSTNEPYFKDSNELLKKYMLHQRKIYDLYQPDKLANALKGYKEACKSLEKNQNLYNDIKNNPNRANNEECREFCSNFEKTYDTVGTFVKNMVDNGILSKQTMLDVVNEPDIDKFVNEKIFDSDELIQIECNRDQPSL